MSRTIAAALLCTMLAATAAPAAERTVEEIGEDGRDRLVAFVVNHARFAVLTQAAAMLADEYGLTIAGDAAERGDRFATFALLQAEDDAMDEAVADAARAAILADGGSGAATAGEGAGARRARLIACLALGADAEAFGALADEIGLPASERADCRARYTETATAWREALGGRAHTGEEPSTATIFYGPADDRADMLARGLLLEFDALGVLSSVVGARWTLPEGVIVSARSCGAPGATWLREQRTIRLCYDGPAQDFDRYLQTLPPAGGR